MDEILSMNVDEIPGLKFDCCCGREHIVDIKKIVIGENAIAKTLDLLSVFKRGKIFL